MTEVYFFQQHAILIFVSQSKDEISDFKNAIKYTNIISESHRFLLWRLDRNLQSQLAHSLHQRQ